MFDAKNEINPRQKLTFL